MDKIAVVFVHGFTGGNATWRNHSGVNFSTLLGLDPAISPSFDFYEFEYFTEVLGVFKSNPVQTIIGMLPLAKQFGFRKEVKANQPIEKLARSLDSYLKVTLSDYEHIVLVAHSMGGLIAKNYILDYEYPIGPQPIGFVSLAVPHKGSIQSYLLSPSGNVNAKGLRPLDEHLNAINDSWVERKESLPEAIYVTAQHDQYVSSVSSEPYNKIPKGQRFYLDKDHNSICKPEDKNDTAFIVVRDFLKGIAYKQSMQELSQEKHERDNNDYDKEIFVIKMILEKINNKGIDDAKDSFFQAEIISRAADKKDKATLLELQTKVLSLYRQTYASCAHKNSSQIFSEVHTRLLSEDEQALKSVIKYINFMHKKGLLHQLANQFNTDVVWSEKTTLEQIKGHL
ncbi:hypothetical protein C6560_16850 [Enterobacter sp. FS01]|nr:hypothetical protein C6560_16850 [Enterobacter sp. FS01]